MNRELGTKLTGRHLNRELFPFSYQEYLKATNTKRGTGYLEEYLNRGGFPAFIKTGEEQMLSDLFEDILVRKGYSSLGVYDRIA